MLKFEFAVEAIIVFVKNIKKALSGIFTLLASQSYELSQFLENLSLLRAQKVLKFEFTVEVIIIFIKNIKRGIKLYIYFIDKSVI